METTFAYQETNSHSMNIVQTVWQRIILLIVLCYEGAGAILGGTLLIASPDGRYMDMSVEIMNGAFRDFLIPGIILLGLGFLNSLAFVSVLRRKHNDWFMAGLALGGLTIWFIVEIIILRELHWLHAMWGIPVLWGIVTAIPLINLRNDTTGMKIALLICGIISSVWYVAINIFVPAQYEGYSMVTFTVSELSAIGAPTRILWVLLAMLYPLLLAAFGWGVLKSADGNGALRKVGTIIIAYSVFNFYWPPMNMRGNEMALTDVLHISWGVIVLMLMFIMIGIGAKVFGKGFRIFSISSIVLYVVFGVLTGIESPNIATNEPTPMIGIWERINIGIFMLWIAVLAVEILKREKISGGAKSRLM